MFDNQADDQQDDVDQKDNLNDTLLATIICLITPARRWRLPNRILIDAINRPEPRSK